MDNRFFSSDPSFVESKLTRASSFSELSSSNKVTLEERYHSQAGGNLVKQYSCEEIFDRQTNKSRVTISQVMRSEDKAYENTWNKEVPLHILTKSTSWPRREDKLPHLRENLSFPIERLSLNGTDNVKSKSIIAPPKLIIQNDESKQSILDNQGNNNSILPSLSSNESCNDSTFQFKRPLTPSKNFTPVKNRYAFKNTKVESDNTSKMNFIKLNKADNSKNEEIKYDYSDLKKRLRSLMAIDYKVKSKSNVYLCWLIAFIILLPITAIYLVVILNYTDISNKFCDPRLKINNIPEELKKFLHGQDNAVDDLTNFFIQKNGQAGFDVVALIGGIGVGKSYTAEIIRNNLKNTGNTVDFFPPLYSKENQAYSSLSICKCNLIRLENLKNDDIVDAVKFASVLKERSKNYCILILALFNLEETDHNLKKVLDLNKSTSLITSKFNELDIQPTVVSYTSLNNEALTKCIQDLADFSGVELASDTMQSIRDNLITADSGCKGAYAKIQIARNTERKSSEL